MKKHINEIRAWDIRAMIGKKPDSNKLIDYRSVLEQQGHFLTTVVFVNEKTRISCSKLIQLLSQYCIRLHQATFKGIKIVKNLKSRKTVGEFKQIIKYLESLTIVDCGLTENFGELIESGVHLIELNLSYNRELSGEFLSKLINLESLNLEMCLNIKPTYFTQILQNNKTLKYLNVKNCALSVANFLDMVNYSENLIHLVITINDEKQLKFVTKVPTLKNLEIYGQTNSIIFLDSLFIDLCRVNQLECLIIVGNKLSTEALGHLKYFTCLKTIRLLCQSDLDDRILNSLTSEMALEHIFLQKFGNITKDGLLNFLKKCPNIKNIDVAEFGKLDLKFFVDTSKYMTNSDREDRRLTKQIQLFFQFRNQEKKIKLFEPKPMLENALVFEQDATRWSLFWDK